MRLHEITTLVEMWPYSTVNKNIFAALVLAALVLAALLLAALLLAILLVALYVK